MKAQAYYISRLKEELSIRQRRNPNYSLRSYAKYLGLHPSTLSQVMKNTRPLPLKDSVAVAARLNLAPQQRTLFLDSLYRQKTKLDQIKIDASEERFMLDESHHRVISEWEHYAVLELFKLNKFKGTTKAIQLKLGITKQRTEVVLENLLTARLIQIDPKGLFCPVHVDICTTEDVKSSALRASHKETLKLATEKIDEVDVCLRDYSSDTLAIDKNKIPEAKAIIREFRRKMTALLNEGEKTDIYQMAIQFFPLTPIESKKTVQGAKK